jgi:hypothetical protein
MQVVAAGYLGSPAWRKTAREYVVFIKASQTFYRQFLKELDICYPGITSLRSISLAISLANDNQQQQQPTQSPQAVALNEVQKESLLDLTCDTLIHLGDLSRWRYVGNLDRSTKSGWVTAASYYKLAQEVCPASGFPQHQLAVLALHDNKVFYALHDLYQSLCSKKAHPEAGSNLDLLLRKRLATADHLELVKLVHTKHGNVAVGQLRAWFLKLHVFLYLGVAFTAHEEMESEVLNRLSLALKDGTALDTTLVHMAVINIAAESVAFEKSQAGVDPLKNAEAYFFFLRHNVRTFLELLKHLYNNLQEHFREGLASNQDSTGSGKLPPVSEPAIFAIRLYSLWFTKNWEFLQKCMSTDQPDPKTSHHIRELFAVFAPVLTMIFEQYPLSDVVSTAELEYLLKEEEQTMGFLPLQGDSTMDVWMKDGEPKYVLRTVKSDGQVETEHLVRLRDLFARGLVVSQDAVRNLYLLVGIMHTNNHLSPLHSSCRAPRSSSMKPAAPPRSFPRTQLRKTRVSP